MKRLAICLLLFTNLVPATTTAQQSTTAKPVVYEPGTAVADSVKGLLKQYWSPLLADTVIIHYQRELPVGTVLTNDEKIQQNITAELRFLHQQLVKRKNISVFQFAADTKENKSLQEFNNLLTIDTGNALYNLLFKTNHANAVILLPDNKCIFFSGDKKWEALTYSFDKPKHTDGVPALAKN